jgi:hypothetical protein
MGAFCPHQRRDFSVSTNEVTEASAEARIWMTGFLRGNEPSPPEEDGMLQVWRSSVETLRRTGIWDRAD